MSGTAASTHAADVRDAAEWIAEVSERLPGFLVGMQGAGRPGFHRYSWSGDLYPERVHWGLGNTVFAAKCWHTIGDRGLDADQRRAMAGFIRGFKRRDGQITDRLLHAWLLPQDALRLARRAGGESARTQMQRAETRQAYSALRLLGEPAETPIPDAATGPGGVEAYIDGLDWNKPWSAGSHFSHLLFFLAGSGHPQRDELTDRAVARVQALQRPDGSWYVGEAPLAQRINGAMKVLTALRLADRLSFDNSRALIDTCLAATHDAQACDNFNVVYVLNYAGKLADGYRREEIERFCIDRLAVYRRHYHRERGGFSFWPGAAGTHYYGARVSRGRDEPDVHGTSLFMWGLSIIAQLLGLDGAGLREVDP